MRRLVTALLVIALAAGCSTRTGGKLGTVAGFGIMGVGWLMKANAFGYGGETDPADVAFIPLTIGALIAIPSLLVWATSKDPDDPPARHEARPDPVAQRRAADRAQAWELTKQAEAAARADDCATVTRLDAEVHGLDRDLHDTVFVRDVAIARCVQPGP